jgi:phage-related protein
MAGFELWQVQNGDDPSDSKPMPSVGVGVAEIRIRIDGAFRILYLAKLPEAVYVLHAFQKKTPKTSKPDIDLAKQRYRDLMGERRSWKK